jgi:hypothetical protein
MNAETKAYGKMNQIRYKKVGRKYYLSLFNLD